MEKNPPQPGFDPQVTSHVPPGVSGENVQPFPVHQHPAPPVIIRAPVFGPESSSVYCHTCNQTVTTKIVKRASGKTHLIALGLCVFGCFLCAPCVYCVDSLRLMNHYCPNCNAYLGAYSAIS